MMAYSGGDEFPCVVAEVGNYSTKMGFAGEDYPRSYFRSTTAILREQQQNNNDNVEEKTKKGSKKTTTALASSSTTTRTTNCGKVMKRSYDFFTRSLESQLDEDGNVISGGVSDGNWDICNPIDRATGLLYEGLPPPPPPTSFNSNEAVSGKADADGDIDMMDTSDNHNHNNNNNGIAAGECYNHLSSYLTHGYQTALCSTNNDTAENELAQTPLLFVERSYNPPPIRQKLLELFFETHNVPATFLARDAVCACYAVGRTTGTVVDVGYGSTVVSPVYDGFVETKGLLRSPVGGEMMEEMVLEGLDAMYKKRRARQQHTTLGQASASGTTGSGGGGGGDHPNSTSSMNGNIDYAMPLYQTRTKDHKARRDPFHRLARLHMARNCKDEGAGAGVAAFGYASFDTSAASSSSNNSTMNNVEQPNEMYQQYANAPKAPYKLPDGTIIDIPQTKRFDVAELLFGKDDFSTQRREDATHKMKKQLGTIISSGEAIGGGSSGGTGGNNNSGGADTESLFAHLEKRKSASPNKGKGTGGMKNLPSSYLAHRSLVQATTPYLTANNNGQIGEITSCTIPNMVCDSAFKCDRDQQAQLLGNVVLCGGGACLSKSAVLSASSSDYQYGNAMSDRVREEVEAIVHTHTPGWRVKVSSPGMNERAICNWLGGSILGSLGSFHDMWITKEEYEEYGASIVNRKCP